MSSSWQQLLKNSLDVHMDLPESRYFQVASVSKDHMPSNRTMVFREFWRDTHNLLSVTDARSDKVKDWEYSPRAQICWYFAESREQYRISAKVGVLDSENHKLDVWKQLSPETKAQFLNPPPKTSLDPHLKRVSNKLDTYSHINRKDLTNSKPASIKVPGSFLPVLFIPDYVDYLCLRPRIHVRKLFFYSAAKERWIVESVNA